MADSVVQPPAQHKQPSRKGKKAWRKNVDITEVQQGLEDVREEITRHGEVLSERPPEQVFVIDTAPSKEVQRAYARTHKVLKADEILAQRSAIPSVDTHKRPADSRVTDGLLGSRPKRAKVSGTEYDRLRKIAYGGETVRKDVVEQGGDANYDPWAVEPPVKDPRFSYLEEKRAKKEPVTLKHEPISQAKDGRKIRAVRRPEAGKSYNPLFEDWQAIIDREGAIAVSQEQERLEEERRDAELQSRIATAQAEAQRDEWESEWESEWEGILSEREDGPASGLDASLLRTKRPERKTPAERNKINRRKAEEARRRHELKMRTKDQDFHRVRALAKAADARSRAALAAASQKFVSAFPDSDASSDEGTKIALRRRRIGKAQIPEAPLEVVLPEELQDSLRRLRPEGNLLKDRYRSALLQGKMESRTAITQPKLAKKKATEKWSYKDWRLPGAAK